MLTNLRTLFGFSGGRRSRRSHRSHKIRKHRGGSSCTEQVAADSSLPQGEAFLKMNQKYHGGRRTRKMRGGAADLTAAFEAIPADIHQRAGTAVLDQAIADLAKFAPQTAQSGGAYQLSGSPIDAPPMLLDAKDEAAAFLNPQWVQENVVNPNFKGPDNALVQAPTTGGARKSRKSRKSRKATRKSRKSRKMRGGKKSRMVCRKGRKGMKGGKKSRKSRKSRKSGKSRKGRKGRKSRRRQGGGAAYSITNAQDFGAPGMLLSPGQEARALESMNPEWKLATDPTSFTPR